MHVSEFCTEEKARSLKKSSVIFTTVDEQTRVFLFNKPGYLVFAKGNKPAC
jgi:hypothetical protein